MSELKMLNRVLDNLLHEIDCKVSHTYKQSDCNCVRLEFRKYIRKIKRRKS